MRENNSRHSFDFCYVISNGFSARMLFQTGLIPTLANRCNGIALIVPDKNDENLIKYTKDNNNISIFEIQLPNSFWTDDYKFKRKYYLENIKTNPALYEKHIHSIRYNKSLHPWRRIRAFYYILIHLLIPYFPSIKKQFIKNESKYLINNEVIKLISNISPKIVIATYPVNILEAQVLFAAKKNNIKTLIHLLSWDNITSKGRFPVEGDEYISWGPIMTNELIEYYQTPKTHIHECGVPHFDIHLGIKDKATPENLLGELNLDQNKPYIVAAMSAPRFSPHEIDIVEWIAQKIEKGELGKNMQLVIRPHPQNITGNMSDNKWLKRLKKLSSDKVAIDYPILTRSSIQWSMKNNDMIRLSHLLGSSLVCINCGSTISIDSMLVGRPVIIASFDGYFRLPFWKSAKRLIQFTHLKKFIALNGVRVVNNYDELKNNILELNKNPNIDDNKIKNALLQICNNPNGNATELVLEVKINILSKIFNKNNTGALSEK